jgi:hypothetical protein
MSFRGAENICMNYMAPDKVHWRVFISTIMRLSGSTHKAKNSIADRVTGALRTSSGMCPIRYLTLKVEAILQSQNFWEETSRDGAQYTSSRGIRK